ncbi:MAG: FimV/HubP family polar landmark protein [Pseudomonadota bacterium]
MRKTPYKTWLLAGLFLLMPWVAHAAGLGKLTIVSALGQPLLAEVDLVSVRAGELATLIARLAPPEAYTQANISYSPALVGVRMSIERRPDGEHYIKIISTRPVNEPFIDLLVELSWPQGRLVREYTALIDPIGYTPPTVAVAPDAPVVSPMAVTPPMIPEPQPIEPARQPPVAAAAPVEAKPAAAKARPAKLPVAAATAAADKAYGPVKRGETLGRIASKVKPPGVTLEQMLVGLYHANPEAFAGNMNFLKTGKILRIPERESVIATGQAEAVKEVRVEAANWNAYRQKLAEAAGESPARESKSAARGKITTKVDDQAAGKAVPKEVLKLSKGEPAPRKARGEKGARGSVPNRIRTLEEEAIAREKSLAEANIRIAQLEKTIKDMQRVIEIKAQAPVAKPAPPPPPPPAPEPDLIAQIMDEPAYLAAVLGLFGLGGYLFVRRRRVRAGDDEPIFTKIEPEIGLETAAVEGGMLARLGGYLSTFRRRAQADAGEATERIAPELGATAATVAAASAASAVAPAITAPAAGSANDIDPLAEADMYLNFGRDVQAEQVLKEMLAKNPGQQEAQLKLLQIYAGRKDKTAFEKIARSLYAQTQGKGDDWVKAAAMGYAFDPANALYEAGKSAPVSMPVVGIAPIGDVDFDFDLGGAPAVDAATTDFISRPATEAGTTLRPGEAGVAADMQSPGELEPALHTSGKETTGAQVSGEPASHMANMIDFQFDTGPAPVAAEPAKPSASGTRPEAAQQPTDADSNGMQMVEPDFKLDINVGDTATAAAEAPALNFDEVSLNFDEVPEAVASPAERIARDDHWHDVQTKFDLAKAYQEMNDRDGARGILREVIKEGDAGQRADAQRLLDKLG